ncbi:MAG: ATP-binding cassette domain-containing protein [Planctomycetia bacterium]|nr:MAG: ATP-binding cassette domain-containing protein [Planctomycetia bacterium]
MIEVRNLCKHYGARKAVDDISFTVNDGEIVGFLGPNGAGKTTTIRILTCYHPATSGSARVAGFDVLSQSMQVRRNVGYLPETVPLYPEMRVREFLRFRGKLRGLSRADRESCIARVVERCWLREVVDRPISQLSKGYRQRVGLADALLHNPRVLILDEPTVGLDPTQIRETRSLIRELTRDHTVILSSHILPEVEATCGRIVIINRGRLVASGTPQELRSRRGDGAVHAEVRAPVEEALSAVRELANGAKVTAEAADGWTRLRVESTSDLREPIFRLSTQRGWTLRELRRDAGSLEDFFVRIVADAQLQAQQ